METIPLEKIANLGNLGDKVNIKSSYTRNFLLSQGKVTVATAENIAVFEARRTELEKAATEKKAATGARTTQLSELVVVLGAHAGDEGKLFDSISTRNIAETVSAVGHPLERVEVRLSNGALRNISELNVAMHLHTNVGTTLKLTIVAK